MNIFRRLHNLWRLSAIEIPKEAKEPKSALQLFFTSKQAKIVDTDNPLDKIII